MSHACPIANCSIGNVPAGVFMCARHWRMVPKPLQAAVYDSFRREGRISANHREAVRVVETGEAGRGATGLPPGMKAFTVWQPWASLIMMNAKPWEFRKWCFTDKPHLAPLVGQRIVLHAGARPMRLSELNDLLARIDEGESTLDVSIAKPFVTDMREKLLSKWDNPIPLAAALGTVVLGQPRNVVDLFGGKIDSDRLDHSMYGWPMSEAIAFSEPVPANGARGFWNWS